MISSNFFRNDLELSKKWRHRLAKIIFYFIGTIGLVILGLFISWEFKGSCYDDARVCKKYISIESSNDKINIVRNKIDLSTADDLRELGHDPDIVSLYIYAVKLFDYDKSILIERSSGLLEESNGDFIMGKVSKIVDDNKDDNSRFREIIDSLYNKAGNNLIGYGDIETRYTIINYGIIAKRILMYMLIYVISIGVILFGYFRGLIYIIYGSKK